MNPDLQPKLSLIFFGPNTDPDAIKRLLPQFEKLFDVSHFDDVEVFNWRGEGVMKVLGLSHIFGLKYVSQYYHLIIWNLGWNFKVWNRWYICVDIVSSIQKQPKLFLLLWIEEI